MDSSKKGEKMDIIIRNVDPTIVKAIDNKAKKIELSRQQYLLNQLNRIATIEAFAEERREYSTLVKNMGIIIQQNTESLQQIIYILQDTK